jgi:tRNA-splicing endonuclease subunit Sen2
MADTHPGQQLAMSNSAAHSKQQPGQRGPPPHQIYALPAPIRTFPLPTFYPNNPVSLFHLGYAWIKQILSPPPREPAVIHNGVWSVATTSVHITDEKSMRALWEQGFYGKGNLSRSEPNWLRREQVRRGLEEGHVSEIHTVERREERMRAKWERARLEQEIIRETRERELLQAEQAKTALKLSPSDIIAPVGPLELLKLPNSAADLLAMISAYHVLEGSNGLSHGAETNGTAGLGSGTNGTANGPKLASATSARIIPGLQYLKQPKTVHFTSESENTNSIQQESADSASTRVQTPAHVDAPADATTAIVNKEHLQLMPEEALWLSFGLGALSVTDAESGNKLTTRDLLTLFRQHCYFPPRTSPDDPELQPDDDFLLHYAVYHYFRSLGWVPRAGIKFGVDWLLYTKGPVFDHAQFGLVVIPSYSDQWWKNAGKSGAQRTWSWLHSIIRVLSHVMKSLVLIYVDVPSPPDFEKALDKGLAEMLKLYKVREIPVKRWSSNRNR